MTVKRGKARAHGAINDGKAVKLAGFEKEVGKATGRSEKGPVIGEFLTGFLNQDRKNALYLVKYGSVDTKYEMRKLFPNNNSQRSAGSRGDVVTEEQAREWLEENDLDEKRLDDFLKAHEILEGLRN